MPYILSLYVFVLMNLIHMIHFMWSIWCTWPTLKSVWNIWYTWHTTGVKFLIGNTWRTTGSNITTRACLDSAWLDRSERVTKARLGIVLTRSHWSQQSGRLMKTCKLPSVYHLMFWNSKHNIKMYALSQTFFVVKIKKEQLISLLQDKEVYAVESKQRTEWILWPAMT